MTKDSRRTPTGAWESGRVAAIMLLPALASITAISVFPVLQGVWLSFREKSLIFRTDKFIGLANYVTLAQDDKFWNAWLNTMKFTVASTVLETVLGLGMALVLYETFSGRGAVRASVLIPWAIPTVVTSKMFGWLFDGQNGIVNYLLRISGIIHGNVNWYGSTEHAMQTIIMADVWKTTPFMALLLLAGLQTIPHSLIEAGTVDGASAWQRFYMIRLPLLLPTMLIASMFRALDAFRIFDLVYVLTGGGPADSTEVLSTITYKTMFSTLQFGLGSAMSAVMFATELLIAVGFAFFIARRLPSRGD